MPVTLVGTVLSSADANTGWSGVTTIDTDSEVQGTGCLGVKVSNATTAAEYASTQNLSTNGYNVIMWLNCTTPTLATIANGGFRIRLQDGTNTADWYVGGQDDRKPGWGAYIINPRSTPTTGSITTSSITSFGGVISTASSIMGNFNNGLWDQITIGTGLQWTGTGGTFQDFADADYGTKNNRWGFVRVDAGIIIPQGILYIGLNATFSDTGGSTVIFDNAPIPDTSVGIRLNSGTTTTIKNAVIDSAGPLWIINRQAGTPTLTLEDCTLNNVGSISTNGMGTVSFQRNTITNTSAFNSTYMITFGSSHTAVDCTFNVNTGNGIGIIYELSNLNQLDNCTFNSLSSTGHAVVIFTAIATDTTWAWNCTANGYATANGSTGNETIRVNVSSGVTLTINVAAGATVPSVYNTGTGTVNVVSGQVTIEVNVTDISTGFDISGARVYLKKVSDESEVVNQLTDSNGQVSISYSYTTDEAIYGWVRLATGANLYKESPLAGTITSNGLTLNTQMIPDV